MVAGFGSGKTEALVIRALRLKNENWQNNIAYYMPTFDLISQIAWPRFDEKLEELKIKATLNQSKKHLEFSNESKIIFRTMDKPSRIIGFEVCDSLVDEIDTLKAKDAENVWRKIVARNRQKKVTGVANSIAVGTTPEGYRFVYETWGKNPRPGYELIHATTYSNAHNLPAGYVQSLLDLYPSSLISAYLEGQFVNLTSGSVYKEFCRKLNGSTETIRLPSDGKPGDPLYIGMDFNVGKMSAEVFVRRGDDPHCVTEITKILDTPEMIATIKRRWPTGHYIRIYPDASGNARKSNNASESDISLLRGAGFDVIHNFSNPAVKDRILSVNGMIHANGKRRLKVNVNECPSFVESLEKQAYDDKGEPDKTSGLDHAADAGGYFICYEFPVKRASSQRAAIVGV